METGPAPVTISGRVGLSQNSLTSAIATSALTQWQTVHTRFVCSGTGTVFATPTTIAPAADGHFAILGPHSVLQTIDDLAAKRSKQP